MPVKKPSMRDIARAVGTSAVTVSRAVAGKPGMSDSLRAKILKKAAELGYSLPGNPGEEAGRHLDIGILIPDRYFGAESFYAGICKKLSQRLSELGHFGLLEILSTEDEKERNLPMLIRSGKADGLILLGEPEKEYYRMIAQHGTPLVFMDFYDAQGSADAVVGDNTYGCYRLTSHLIRNGHRKIGFVGNVKSTGSIMDRYLGYYRAMLAHDLPVREEWVLKDRAEDGTMTRLILPEELPTAFVCNCDTVAADLIRMLREKGLRVPEDVSVTGFDDFLPGAETEPELSTFRVDTDAMSELAVKLVTERCRGSRDPFGRTVIGGQPVYRHSESEIQNA